MRTQRTNTRDSSREAPHLIGVGVDGAPDGRDAVVLAAMLARATQAELGNVAGELLSHLECPLPIAPLGMQDDSGARRTLLRDVPAPILIAPRPRHAATV